MATITENIDLPDGSAPPPSTIVEFMLVGTDGDPVVGYVGGHTVTGFIRLRPDGTGGYSVQLQKTADITPAGTRWRRTISGARIREIAYLNVTGDGTVQAMLDQAPGTLAPPGALAAAANLSDVADPAIARANLGAVAKAGDTMTGELVAPDVKVAKNGLSARALAGRKTSTGAPSTGAWNVDDEIQDSSGQLWRCTVAGGPGTWVQVGAYVQQGGQVVSVKDAAYGAVGNNVADDTTAVAAALDAVAVNGGVLYFPPGTYKVGRIVRDYSSLGGGAGIHIKGAGRGATTIVMTDPAASSQRVFHLTQVTDFECSGITFKQDNQNAFGAAINLVGNATTRNTRVLIADCNFIDNNPQADDLSDRMGVVVEGVTDCQVRGNYLKNTQIEVSHWCEKVRITDNYCETPFHLGIVCIVDATTGNYLRDIVIADNIVKDPRSNAISVGPDTSSTASGAVICENITITGNIVTKSQFATSGNIGIQVLAGTQAAVHAVIANNYVSGMSIRAVPALGTTISDVLIVSNHVKVKSATFNVLGINVGLDGTGNGQTYDGARDCQVQNNVVNDVDAGGSSRGLFLQRCGRVTVTGNRLENLNQGIRCYLQAADGARSRLITGNAYTACTTPLVVDSGADVTDIIFANLGDTTTAGLSALTGILFARKTADESVTSSATAQDDDQLTVNVVPGAVYEYRLVAFYEAATTGDIRFNWKALPSGATIIGGQTGLSSAASATSGQSMNANTRTTAAATLTAGGAGAGAVAKYVEEGLLIMGGSAGAFTLQWSQAASDAVASIVHAGSYLRLQQVA